MTAAEKLRELLATRPALPNTEELVRWWRVSGELVEAFIQERAELISDLVVADKRNESLREQLAAATYALKAARQAWCPVNPGGDGADGETYALVSAALQKAGA